MKLEKLGELDQRLLRFKIAERVLRELKEEYPEREANVIIPALAMVIACRNRMEAQINDLENERESE